MYERKDIPSMNEDRPSIQNVVDTGMSTERIREVVNGIANGLRVRSEPHMLTEPVHMSLARIADALEYLVALDRRTSGTKAG